MQKQNFANFPNDNCVRLRLRFPLLSAYLKFGLAFKGRTFFRCAAGNWQTVVLGNVSTYKTTIQQDIHI